MAERRKRRVRTSHPGVKLLKLQRKEGAVWHARWVDPDTRRSQQVSLNSIGVTSESARRAWAISKSRVLANRRAELAAGAEVRTYTEPNDAIEKFFLARKGEVADGTIKSYRDASRPFLTWAKWLGLHHIEELTAPKLSDFRDWYVSRAAWMPYKKKGAGRGARVMGTRERSPATTNKVLSKLRTMLNWCRKRGLTPSLDSDAIRDHLAYVKAPKPLPTFLRTEEIKQLLGAAAKHDHETFKLTREERAGQKQPGSTAKYQPMLPFVLAGLLTGCRFSELARLRWSDVHLSQHEVRLSHKATKTGHGRVVRLDITPLLTEMLTRMHLKADGAEFVFGYVEKRDGTVPVQHHMRRDIAETARRRMVDKHGAPAFTWHELRRTCGTFLTCAPSIFGGASAYMSAKRLGHSVAVAEKHYLGALHSVPKNAKTLEAAMDIEKWIKQQLGRKKDQPPLAS